MVDKINVEHLGRQHLQISASTVLPIAPELAFTLITHPENEKIFRHLERCTHHEVLERDDGAGRVVVESEHLATWRFFALSGRLRTRLRVEQDCRALVCKFKLVPGRFNILQTFAGQWEVLEQPPTEGGGQCCLLSLEQEMRPAVFLPPPLGAILRQLACRQLRGIFQDLRAEAARITAGRPTLWPADAPQQPGGGCQRPPTPHAEEVLPHAD